MILIKKLAFWNFNYLKFFEIKEYVNITKSCFLMGIISQILINVEVELRYLGKMLYI